MQTRLPSTAAGRVGRGRRYRVPRYVLRYLEKAFSRGVSGSFSRFLPHAYNIQCPTITDLEWPGLGLAWIETRSARGILANESSLKNEELKIKERRVYHLQVRLMQGAVMSSVACVKVRYLGQEDWKLTSSLPFTHSLCKSSTNALRSEEHAIQDCAACPMGSGLLDISNQQMSLLRCGLARLHVSRRHTMNKVLGSWNVSRVHGSDLPLSGAGKGSSSKGLCYERCSLVCLSILQPSSCGISREGGKHCCFTAHQPARLSQEGTRAWQQTVPAQARKLFSVRLALPNRSGAVSSGGMGSCSRQANTKNKCQISARSNIRTVWVAPVLQRIKRSRWEGPLACRSWCHQSLISA